MKIGQVILKTAALLLGALLLGSYAGAFHPAGDSFAVFRLPLAVLLALSVVWTDWPRRLRWPVAAVSLAILGAAIWQKSVDPAPGPMTIYQKNLWFGNRQVDVLAQDILAHAPDMVTLQEVSDRNRQILDLLAQDYPHRIFCPFTSWSGMAVLSRWPATETQCSDGRGMAALRIATPQGPVWAVSLHLHWPWPHRQAQQRDALLPVLEALEGPVVIGGDFNMVPWGHSVRSIARATGTQRAGGLFPTFEIRHVPLPIDHILAPGGGYVARLSQLGSDHFSLLGRVHLRAE